MKTLVFVLVYLFTVGFAFAINTSAETNIFPITPETLPVELSSFSAVQTATGYVALRWTTESESQLLGYHVYRAESSQLASAIQVSQQIIYATNTSTTQVYGFEDREVELGHSYYYWLESRDCHSYAFHGPIYITLSPTDTPQLPLQTVLQAIYPNPFRKGSTAQIEVLVKDSETAEISIYNLAGQRVKSYSLAGGAHLLVWDAKDNHGNLCGSGIYFVKLSSGSITKTAKLMLIK